MEIRKAVQAGQVEEAIDKVNDLNPEVRCTARVVQGFSKASARVQGATRVQGSGCGVE
jgi:hypothetical protein